MPYVKALLSAPLKYVQKEVGQGEEFRSPHRQAAVRTGRPLFLFFFRKFLVRALSTGPATRDGVTRTGSAES